MIKKLLSAGLCASLIFGAGCSTIQNMSNTGKGTAIGTAGGAALGSGIGALAGGGKGAWIGALVGGAVGAGTGALIGNKMDKQQKALEEELANVNGLGEDGYTVETVKDSNDLQAIRLVLGNAILFQTGKSDLSATAQAALSRVATNLAQYPQTDITVMGYTDNTGGYDLNMRLSQERADAVRNYLIGRGIPAARLTAKGNGWSNPVASNDTKEGRAQNRRVEMYITANEQMINEAAATTQQ